MARGRPNTGDLPVAARFPLKHGTGGPFSPRCAATVKAPLTQLARIGFGFISTSGRSQDLANVRGDGIPSRLA